MKLTLISTFSLTVNGSGRSQAFNAHPIALCLTPNSNITIRSLSLPVL